MDIYHKCYTRLYGKKDDFNFAIINFPPPDSNVPASLAYGVYILKLTCCSCRQSTCLHVVGSVLWCTLLFPRKTMFDFFWLPFVFVRGSYISILFVFIYAYWCATRFPFQMVFVSLSNIMKGFTYGAGTANPSGALELNPPFWNSSCSIFSFLCYVL